MTCVAVILCMSNTVLGNFQIYHLRIACQFSKHTLQVRKKQCTAVLPVTGSSGMGVRTWGQMGSADPPGKIDEKLKSENMQKEQFSMFMLYFESNQGRQM